MRQPPAGKVGRDTTGPRVLPVTDFDRSAGLWLVRLTGRIVRTHISREFGWPVIDLRGLATGEFSGAEGGIRIRDPHLGKVP